MSLFKGVKPPDCRSKQVGPSSTQAPPISISQLLILHQIAATTFFITTTTTTNALAQMSIRESISSTCTINADMWYHHQYSNIKRQREGRDQAAVLIKLFSSHSSGPDITGGNGRAQHLSRRPAVCSV
ncbi:hypothetical protein EYF80_024421 [Liparis tanakae]|uniref:Uncharacterized protein n=1 Tax=Liparis tanakae TaxID=230148 RepID=A0A4Z2HJF3_9TELE|nr:hypothetical protein EYF80_024421 [Liparis tanakae]